MSQIAAIFVIFVAVFMGGRASAQSFTYPDGLRNASDAVSGIYPGNDAGSCCWMGRRSVMRIDPPPGADTLILAVFIPHYALAPGQMQSFDATVGNRPQRLCCFGEGMHELALRLANRRGEAVIVSLTARYTFVPARVGINADPRELSVLIRSVRFYDTVTGKHFGALEQSTERALVTPLLWIATIAIVVLSFWRPVMGAIAFIVTDPFLIAYGIRGTMVTLPKLTLPAVAFVGLLRIRDLLRLRGFRALAGPLFTIVALAGVMALSAGHAVPGSSAHTEVLKYFEYAGTLLAAYLAYRVQPDERAVCVAVALMALVTSGFALIQEFGGAPQAEYVAGHAVPRIAGLLEGPNQFAAFCGIVAPVLLAFMFAYRDWPLLRVAFIASVAACVLTLSRGGVVALIVGCALVYALRTGVDKRRIAYAAAALFAVALLWSALIGAGVLHGHLGAGAVTATADYNGGLGTRSELWQGAVQMVKHHPLLGVGPGSYDVLISQYAAGVRTHPNSLYYQILAEEGVVGFAALIAFLLLTANALRKKLNVPLALAGMGVLAAIAIHQVVDTLWFYPKVGIEWFAVIGIALAACDAASEPVNA